MSELGPDFDQRAVEVCGLYLEPPPSVIQHSYEGVRGSSPRVGCEKVSDAPRG
jgi:hypothetical protein